MKETRRTKDWITPEILEKSHQQHQMMAREAMETSDNIGAPIAEAQSVLNAFVPDAKDIASLASLFDKRFFKLFFIGVGLSGLLMLCAMGAQRFQTADKTDWASLYSYGRTMVSMRRYDDAQKYFEAGLQLSYIDSAEKSCLYGELAKLADRRGDEQSEREYRLKEQEFSQLGAGLVTILIAAIILFSVTLTTALVFKRGNENAAIGWHQPLVVGMAAFSISLGIHMCAPFANWVVMTIIAGGITFVVLALSAALDGSAHPHFVVASRK